MMNIINVCGTGQNVTGYIHPGYTESLSKFGTPRELHRSRGWIFERQIPGSPYHDVMGRYPLFACQEWSQLHADLEDIGNELVSLSLWLLTRLETMMLPIYNGALKRWLFPSRSTLLLIFVAP